jgi:hypothetical protein
MEKENIINLMENLRNFNFKGVNRNEEVTYAMSLNFCKELTLMSNSQVEIVYIKETKKFVLKTTFSNQIIDTNFMLMLTELINFVTEANED